MPLRKKKLGTAESFTLEGEKLNRLKMKIIPIVYFSQIIKVYSCINYTSRLSLPCFVRFSFFLGLSEDKLFEALNSSSRKASQVWLDEDSQPKELPSQAIKSLSEVTNFQLTFVEAIAAVITHRFDFFKRSNSPPGKIYLALDTWKQY